MKKPRIRLSRISMFFVCSGQGATGSGMTMREAWHSWQESKVMRGAR